MHCKLQINSVPGFADDDGTTQNLNGPKARSESVPTTQLYNSYIKLRSSKPLTCLINNLALSRARR